MIKIFPIFIGITAFMITTKILIRKGNNGFQKSIDEFTEKEIKANSIRKDLNSLSINYISPDKDLPFKEYDTIPENKKIIKKQETVRKKLNLDMIKLPPNLSNTEIKEIYGVNNFDKISILEEHFNGYVKALLDWATELYHINNLCDCENVLLEAVRIQGDISQIYALLVDIYFQQNDIQKITDLRENIQNYELSLKDKILNEIDEKLNLAKR